MIKVFKHVFLDLVKSNLVLAYAAVCLLTTIGLEYMNAAHEQTMVSMLHVVILLIPLVTILFGSIYFFQSREFIELLVTQPVSRKSVFVGHYLGLSIALILSITVGIFLPMCLYSGWEDALLIFIPAIFLTLVFSSFSYRASVRATDKAKGIARVLFIWIFLSIIYDGLLMLILVLFADYPLEKVLLSLSFLNPIDLARILVMLKLDVSALLGITGAVFKSFFGSSLGWKISAGVLFLWFLIPFYFALKSFERKDF